MLGKRRVAWVAFSAWGVRTYDELGFELRDLIQRDLADAHRLDGHVDRAAKHTFVNLMVRRRKVINF